MRELKIRVPVSLHRAITFAAARRGVASSALVSMVIHEYLHERDELAPTQEGATQVPTSFALPGEWLEDDEPLNVGS